MKDFWIAPEQLFDGQDIVTGQAVRIADGHVVEVAQAPDTARPVSGCLTPGFVDLQVNGGGGVMLNTTPSRAGMADIAAAHRKCGTVAILPTVITDHPDVLDQAAEATIAAKGDQSIVGLHIEGPHISVARRGTHNADFIRPMDARTMAVVERLRQHDIAVLMTAAPEAITNDQITALAELGVVVSLGHTDATAEIVEGAIAAGASCATHLFNAMSPMVGRAPGAVGAVINSHLTAGFICDGYHVDDRMLQLALRARPADGLMFLVSDAMATVGGPDSFELYGQRVQLQDGRLVNAEGNLAGAHITQAQGVARLVQHLGISRDQAFRMATTIPAKVIGRPDLAEIAGRSIHDLMILSDDLELQGTLAGTQAALMAHDAAE